MGKCIKCGSYAINHGLHGRDGIDPDLCDVCYWRKRADDAADEIDRLRECLRNIRNFTGPYHPFAKTIEVLLTPNGLITGTTPSAKKSDA